ncbi:MAG: tagaturonate epimerase family protein [Bythopirellula sp.]|nr:tagaturonate epimerase family protein [Bythopirellula sp.]
MASTVPRPTTLGMTPSFGFGDRIGLATPGHLAALRRAGQGIAPIFAQQSIREMARTSRTPEGVMGDAMQALAAGNWSDAHGADADHLKTREDVDRTAVAGFTFFTIDPSGHVDQKADDYDAGAVREKFNDVREYAGWTHGYVGKDIKLSTGTTIKFDELSVQRAAVKYGRAIREAIELAIHIRQVQEAADRPFEIELSVDETEQPTTLAEHFIIAEQCLLNDMKLVSLAPRFIGHFEKGVDYIGDHAALDKSLNDHAAIARQLGPYKISLHSGSDKVSMYAALSRATQGQFHVKTAGTSYLEALRVVAIHEPAAFRELCEFSCSRYDTDRATYHVHATLDTVPAPSQLNDTDLVKKYLERWEDVPTGKGFTEAGRQILHCTFGSVLTDARFGKLVKQCLSDHQDTYAEVLEEHFARHLDALRAGM